MESREHSALLALVQAGLWEEAPKNPATLSLPEQPWRHVLALSRQQTVAGLAFRGLQYLPDELLPPTYIIMKWAAITDSIERKNREMNQVLSALCHLFHTEGLHPVLQKGQGIAALYADPLLRECGDIDLFFASTEEQQAAQRIIQGHGIPLKKKADGSLSYRWQGIEVEHHERLIDLHNPFLQDFMHHMIDRYGYQHILPFADNATNLTTPSPFLNLLLLNLHILKHAIGRGIGLRQLCDIARAYHHYAREIDGSALEMCCRKLGIGAWTSLLHAFLVEALGLPADRLPFQGYSPSAAPLAEIIWRGGNFGQYGNNRGTDKKQWFRKQKTVVSFLQNIGFSLRYAPKEVFWTFTNLLKGQQF